MVVGLTCCVINLFCRRDQKGQQPTEQKEKPTNATSAVFVRFDLTLADFLAGIAFTPQLHTLYSSNNVFVLSHQNERRKQTKKKKGAEVARYTMTSINPRAPASVFVLLLVVLAFAPTPSISASPQPFDIDETYRQLLYSYSSYCNVTSLSNWDCYFCNYNLSLTGGFVFYSFLENATQNVFGFIGYRGSTGKYS